MTTKLRFHEIDLLRGFACLMVVAFHYLYRGQKPGWIESHAPVLIEHVARYGYLGVNLFFMISGFVIFMSAEHSGVRDFLASRVARLYPAFWAAVPLTALIAWWLGSAFFQVGPKVVIVNMTMVPHWFDVDFVDGAYWSLAVEMHFYIAVALSLALGLMKRPERLAFGWLLVCLVYAVRPIYALDLWLNARWGPFFCIGVCSYLIRTRGASPFRWALFVSAFALAVFETVDRTSRAGSGDNAWVLAGAVSAFSSLFVLIALGKWRMRASPLTHWAGLATYPVYLLHQNIGYVLLAALAAWLPHFGTRLLVVVAAIGTLAWVLVRFVEKPLGPRLRRAIALGLRQRASPGTVSVTEK